MGREALSGGGLPSSHNDPFWLRVHGSAGVTRAPERTAPPSAFLGVRRSRGDGLKRAAWYQLEHPVLTKETLGRVVWRRAALSPQKSFLAPDAWKCRWNARSRARYLRREGTAPPGRFLEKFAQ